MLRYIGLPHKILRAYSALAGKSAIVYPAAFLVALGLGQVGLGLIFYLREVFSSPATVIGWLAATWSLAYIVGCLLVRPAFDTVPPPYLIVVANFLMTGFTLGMQFVPSISWIFALHGLYGMAVSHFWPPLMGWLSSEVEGEALNRACARFNLSWCLGGIISPYLAGWLSEMNVRLPLLGGSALFLLTAVYVAGTALVKPKTGGVSTCRAAGGQQNAALAPDRSTLLRYPAWVGLFATYFAMGVIASIFPVIGQDDLLLSRSSIGLLLLVRSLVNAVAFLALGRLVFWHFRVLPMLMGQLMAVCGFVLLAHVHEPVLVGVLLGIFGITLAMSYSSSLFHGASGSRNRPARMAVHESVLAAGLVAGAGVGGMVYHAHGAARLFYLCALVVLVALLAQGVLCVWARRCEERQCEETPHMGVVRAHADVAGARPES